jgi:hypothetical protein
VVKPSHSVELVEAGAIAPRNTVGLEQGRFEATAMRCAYVDELFLAGQKARQEEQYGSYEIIMNLSTVLTYLPNGKTTKGS